MEFVRLYHTHIQGGGSNARLGGGGGGGGGRELRLLGGFNWYALFQNRDNSGLLGTPVYYSLKFGGGGGGGGCPPVICAVDSSYCKLYIM